MFDFEMQVLQKFVEYYLHMLFMYRWLHTVFLYHFAL